MKKGAQVNPHKYITRHRGKDGKWLYVYNPTHQSLEEVMANSKEVRVVIAHGKPTPLRINSASEIVIGPPNIVGRVLMANKNKERAYFGRALDTTGQLPPVYLYPESHAKKVVTKKAAKFVKLDRGLVSLNRKAELMLRSSNPEVRDYGLVIWLNNNTHMRVGAHSDAMSIDPIERAFILKQAREKNWSEELKNKALQQARKPTFGLLTLRNGHLHFDSRMTPTVSFRFRGKGGKENLYTVEVPPDAFNALYQKKYGGSNYDPNKPLFPSISYKRLWRLYGDYGITPHMARGQYADSLIRELMRDFKVKDSETLKAAEKRFMAEIQSAVSDHLNHSRVVTLRHYISPTTQRALKAFTAQLKSRVDTSVKESGEYTDGMAELAEVLLWREFGVGNTVI